MAPNVSTPTLTPMHCIECGRAWESTAERWRLKVLFEDVQTPEPVPYCPDCHAREFDA